MFLVTRRPSRTFNSKHQDLGLASLITRLRGFATCGLPPAPVVADIVNNKEGKKAAREWIEVFRKAKIQRSDVDSLSFARCSGPGGQNVNKVNTKSIVRCAIGSSRWIPSWAKDTLRKSPVYVKTDDSLLVSSTRHRSQAENVEDCLSKLHTLVLNASAAGITNDPTPEQQQRVKDLQKVHSNKMKKEKQNRSAVKQGRRAVFD